MTLVLGCAATATVGVALVVLAIKPRSRSLAAELDQLLGPGTIKGPGPRDFWGSFNDSLCARAGRAGERFPLLVKDLAATEQSPKAFTRQIVTMAALFAALAAGVVAAFTLEGLHLGVGVGMGVVALAAAVGALLPRPVLRGQATERRAEMRDVVAVICDLAAVLVAAGEDIDGALVSAAGAGTGWAFDAVQASLPLNGRTGIWVGLERLGERLGVEELVILAQNMGLAEERGAKVRDALNAQARTLREEAAAEVEAKAGSMTERMSFPMVMLLAGFLLVIGYPAMARL